MLHYNEVQYVLATMLQLLLFSFFGSLDSIPPMLSHGQTQIVIAPISSLHQHRLTTSRWANQHQALSKTASGPKKRFFRWQSATKKIRIHDDDQCKLANKIPCAGYGENNRVSESVSFWQCQLQARPFEFEQGHDLEAQHTLILSPPGFTSTVSSKWLSYRNLSVGDGLEMFTGTSAYRLKQKNRCLLWDAMRCWKNTKTALRLTLLFCRKNTSCQLLLHSQHLSWWLFRKHP